jgi:hypothetical protein
MVVTISALVFRAAAWLCFSLRRPRTVMNTSRSHGPSSTSLLCRADMYPSRSLSRDGTMPALCEHGAALTGLAKALCVRCPARPSRLGLSRLGEPPHIRRTARLLACTIFDPRQRPSNHSKTSGSIACLTGTGALLACPDVFEV